jgi:hypothetical protein
VDQVLTGTVAALVSSGPSDTTPNFEIDLGSAQSVSHFELINDNRLAVNLGRLQDLTLTLYDGSHSQIKQVTGINAGNNGYGLYTGNPGSYVYGPGQLNVDVTPAVSARYVKIARTISGATDDTRLLTLMEMEVFAFAGSGGGSSYSSNITVGGPIAGK